jgi:hypothetical protein
MVELKVEELFFFYKTNGSNFSVIKAFADWGKNPFGDLLNGNDGFYYGTSTLGELTIMELFLKQLRQVL